MQTLVIPKNTIIHNLAKRIIVFESNPEKVIICLDQIKQFLKDCRYPEHVISETIFNAKPQYRSPNPEGNKNFIPFITSYYSDIDNKSLKKQTQKYKK